MRACVNLAALCLLVVAPAPVRAFAQTSDTSTQETSDGPRQVVRPHWRKIPNGDDMARFYPEDAVRRGVSGKVVMSCTVSKEGTLYACTVVSETPPNEGFGAAALKLAPYFEMTPQLEDGRTVNGGMVRIPVVFNIEGAEPAKAGPQKSPPSLWAAIARWLLALIISFVAVIQSIA